MLLARRENLQLTVGSLKDQASWEGLSIATVMGVSFSRLEDKLCKGDCVLGFTRKERSLPSLFWYKGPYVTITDRNRDGIS